MMVDQAGSLFNLPKATNAYAKTACSRSLKAIALAKMKNMAGGRHSAAFGAFGTGFSALACAHPRAMYKN
jgi:hypothetical protein